MKKYLILGGSGFIGRYIVETLCKNNRVIVADVRKRQEFDLWDNHLVSTLLPEEGTEHIIAEVEQNIFPTIRLLDSMVRCNVEKIIFVSSGGTVYGEGNGRPINESSDKRPICNYGICKSIVEEYPHL